MKAADGKLNSQIEGGTYETYYYVLFMFYFDIGLYFMKSRYSYRKSIL